MNWTFSSIPAVCGVLLWLSATAAYAAPACDNAAIGAMQPVFKTPADVQIAWTETDATAHVSSMYFLLHTTRHLSSNDANGLAQIFEAQLQLLGWHESHSETGNSDFFSTWTTGDKSCGTLQITFDLQRMETGDGAFYGEIEIIKL